MVTLNLLSSKFGENDKWPLLYVFADIYTNRATKDKPLSDTDVVKIARNTFGLSIERRTVKKYRNYLTLYFGFDFVSEKKGHYLKNNASALIRQRRKDLSYLLGIPTYGSKTQEDIHVLVKKVSLIEEAIAKKHFISIGVPNYIAYERGKEGVRIIRKTLVATPIEVFRFDREYYVFAYEKEAANCYVFLLRNVTIKRHRGDLTSSDSGLDPNAVRLYTTSHDFLLTGPVTLKETTHYSFSQRLWLSKSRSIKLQYPTKRPIWETAHHFLLQTLLDLYGANKIKAFIKDEEAPICDGDSTINASCKSGPLRIEFPYDEKADAILKRIEYSGVEISRGEG